MYKAKFWSLPSRQWSEYPFSSELNGLFSSWRGAVETVQHHIGGNPHGCYPVGIFSTPLDSLALVVEGTLYKLPGDVAPGVKRIAWDEKVAGFESLVVVV